MTMLQDRRDTSHATKEAEIRAQLSILGLRWANCISWNDAEAALYQDAIERGEATMTATGGLAVTTGSHTGRSPNDKFIVRNEATERTVWWDNNAAMLQAKFDRLKNDMLAHARLKSLFVQDLVAGADKAHALQTRVITEHAWQALFIRHLLIKTDRDAPFAPQLTILCLPTFKACPASHGTRSDTVIALDLKAGLVLIGGTHYAGEIKKSVFTVMNHLLPEQDVLPMHCSANVGKAGDTAIFFGLSGTGKTTLSTDPERMLIGDDEHGWSSEGVFNFEGGCYAKAINLSAAAEPEIYGAACHWGTVLENVVVDPDTRLPNFADASLTENTRLAYPLTSINNASREGRAAAPKAIIMLTADAFGVLPPISRLTPEQAMQWFLAGYTAKVAGTERGLKEPKATFSACFGAPFLTRHPTEYGDMLRVLIANHDVPVFLVNTGWTGGAYGTGKRFPIAVTRRLVNAALSGKLNKGKWREDKVFGFEVPVAVEGVEATQLDPRKAWADANAYDTAARNLRALFEDNAQQFAQPATHRIAAE